MTQPPSISIIIVSYNTKDLLLSSVRSALLGSTEISREIIVVDNASGDGSPGAIEENFQNAKLIVNTENKGYAKAANDGISASKGDYLLFLNSDARLIGNALSTMARFLEENPGCGACGPMLVDGEGNPAHSFDSFPVWWSELGFLAFWKNIYWRNANRQRAEFLRRNSALARPFQVDFVSGACMMIPRRVVDDIGRFDERFFMFYEDTDLCYRMKLRGLERFCIPEAKTFHAGGSSFHGADFYSMLLRAQSKIIYFEKHHPERLNWLRRAFFLRACLAPLRYKTIALLKKTEKNSLEEKIRFYRCLLEISKTSKKPLS